MPKIWKGCVQRLHEAFWSLLEKKPYAQISVSEILTCSRVSRGDFYYHYDNLMDLAKSAVQAEAESWDDLALLFLNFDKMDTEMVADQIYYFLSFVCNQNPLKVKRLSTLLSPHSNMYLLETFKDGFKYYIAECGNLDLERFSDMQKILFEGVIGFCSYLLVHLDLLKNLKREDLKILSRKLAATICAFANT